MDILQKLIETNENWLTERVLAYALEHGYTADSSTLEQPWRASICGFSDVMLATLAAHHWPPDIHRKAAPEASPLIEFSAAEAKLHRQRGVPLDQYLGLTKYYRLTYLELIAEHFPRGDEADKYRQFIHLFFDHAEISICAEWEKQDSSVTSRSAADANRHLINEKNRYLTIFESLSEPVIILDEDGNVTNRNLAAGLLFDSKAVSGEVYYGDQTKQRPNPQIANLIEHAGDARELEYQLETRSGKKTFFVKIQRMLDVSEKFVGTVIILSDVTEIRAAQEASEAANRAKSTFLATMSHEIRTPVNGILGIGQLLQETPLKDTQKAYIDALLSSGELLQDLVNDVLDYSKLEAGETELRPGVFSPGEMVERIAQLSIGEAGRKGLALNIQIADDCPEMVEADHGKIQRILVNLTNNAVKFTKSGTVTVSAKPIEGGISFAIRDTGPGIPKSKHDDVFEPFIQHIPENADRPVGTGLGLAICRRLADTLGAELALSQPSSGGSLFTLNCPVVAVEDTQNYSSADDKFGVPLNILLVEDNAINTMVTMGFLEKDGHVIETIERGEVALERLKARRYDLVLMDIRLHGIDGFEVISQIRTHPDPSINAVPILVLTADQTDDTIKSFARSGANGLRTKPFNRDELRRAIDRALGSKTVVPTVKLAPAPDTVPVLDDNVIAEHKEAIGSLLTQRIITAFLDAAPGYKETLNNAVQQDDRDAISRIVHTLKGTAAMTGLMQLGQSAEAYEEKGLGKLRTAELQQVSDTLCAQINDGISALTALVEAEPEENAEA